MERYFLILEKRPGDFMPIDISLLSMGFNSLNNIELIDKYTEVFLKEELIDNIKKANIVTDDYLNGKLYIIDEKKNKYPVVFKKTFFNFDVIEFIYYNIENKDLMNTIYNLYQKNAKNNLEIDVNDFKVAIENKDIAKIIFHLQMLPYIKLRCIKFYIKEKLIKNTKK